MSGPLPVGLIDEVEARFAPADVRRVGNRVLLRVPGLDQPALRALLTLIWDVGAELRSIVPDVPERLTHPAADRRTP